MEKQFVVRYVYVNAYNEAYFNERYEVEQFLDLLDNQDIVYSVLKLKGHGLYGDDEKHDKWYLKGFTEFRFLNDKEGEK